MDKKYVDIDLKMFTLQLGFMGIGVAKTFVHVDTRDVPVMWVYG